MIARAFERDSLFSLIAGPLVWTGHFLTLYIFTAIACAKGFFHDEMLGVRVVQLCGAAVTVVAVVLILDTMMLFYRRWRGRSDGQPAPSPPHDANDVASRRRFMAHAGFLLSGLALIATIWETLPIVFFATCE